MFAGKPSTHIVLVARPHLAREFEKCGLELVALCQTPNQTLSCHRRE